MKDFLISAMQSQVMGVGILGLILAFLACRNRWNDARKVGIVLMAVVAVFYVYSAMLDRIELEEMIAKNDEAWHQLMDDDDHMPSGWGTYNDHDYPNDPMNMTAQKDITEGIQVEPNDDPGPGQYVANPTCYSKDPMGPKDPTEPPRTFVPTPMPEVSDTTSLKDPTYEPTPEAGSSNHYDYELVEKDLARTKLEREEAAMRSWPSNSDITEYWPTSEAEVSVLHRTVEETAWYQTSLYPHG